VTELKPCPFCGGPAEDLGDPDCNDFVRCTACDCYGPKGGAAAWNRRHAEQTPHVPSPAEAPK